MPDRIRVARFTFCMRRMSKTGATTKNPAMKSLFRTLLVVAVSAGFASTASAEPRSKGTGTFKSASTAEEIQKLKKGDRYALVCTKCKSITVKEVADEKEVAALCHNGGTVHCDSCKKDYTVKTLGPRSKGGSTVTEVTIVNAEGKTCMFVVPMQ